MPSAAMQPGSVPSGRIAAAMSRMPASVKKEIEMPEPPSLGRYAEIPYEPMTAERQEGYRSVREVRGQVSGPSKIWVHNPKLVKAAAPGAGNALSCALEGVFLAYTWSHVLFPAATALISLIMHQLGCRQERNL